MKSSHHKSRRMLSLAALSFAVLAPVVARAQGTGGTTAPGGAFAGTDVFLSVQEQEGVNLNDLNRARFLNRANCLCEKQAWVKAVVLASGAGRAASVNQSATVSMYLGSSCDQDTLRVCCHRLKSEPFSQFRVGGIEAETNVDALARIWSTTSGNCGETTTDPSTGTGGSVGTGGVDGTGGAIGTGGSTGTGGVGGTGGSTGTGGNAGVVGTGGSGGSIGVPTGRCSGTQFGQTLWVLIGTMGEGSHDIATATLGFTVDPEPPVAPANISIRSANEALLVSWSGISTTDVADLLGYQVLCTRGDTTQVFRDGTFSPAFESGCSDAAGGGWPMPGSTAQGSFVCSSLLSPAATSYRLKILENDITYNVAVAAIDKQGNASILQPTVGIPMETKDFYSVYRHGDPQGQATGGFCSISGDSPTGRSIGKSIGLTLAALGGLGVLAAAFGRWRRPRRRP